jgi:hypothetical protein
VAPIVATAVLLLLQVPPGTLSVSVTEPPATTVEEPLMVPGLVVVVIVMGCVEIPEPHGPEIVKVITTLPPATPVTTPPDEIVAIAGLLLLQVPPNIPNESKRDTESPTHTDDGPTIIPLRVSLTVIAADTEQPVPVL